MTFEVAPLTKPALRYLQGQLGTDMKTLLKMLYYNGTIISISLKKGEIQLIRQLLFYKLISVKKIEYKFETSIIGEWKPYDYTEYRLNEDGISLVKTLFNFDPELKVTTINANKSI